MPERNISIFAHITRLHELKSDFFLPYYDMRSDVFRAVWEQKSDLFFFWVFESLSYVLLDHVSKVVAVWRERERSDFASFLIHTVEQMNCLSSIHECDEELASSTFISFWFNKSPQKYAVSFRCWLVQKSLVMCRCAVLENRGVHITVRCRLLIIMNVNHTDRHLSKNSELNKEVCKMSAVTDTDLWSYIFSPTL